MEIPASGGCYVLVLRAPAAGLVQVGRLGTVSLEVGFYLYVGSAFGPGGLRARVARHMRGPGRLHWHVDYLRRRLPLREAWFQPQLRSAEHAWASALGRGRGMRPGPRGFGASDCDCATHLFFSPCAPSLGDFARRLRRAGSDPGQPVRRLVC